MAKNSEINMKKLHQFLLSVVVLYSGYATADTNTDKIRFVQKMYREQSTQAHSPRYYDATERYATGKLAKSHALARKYDQLTTKVLNGDVLDQLCLEGVTQMYGGGQDFDLDTPRTYKAEADGRISVGFKQYSQVPESSYVTVKYSLAKHNQSYKVADMEIRLASLVNGGETKHIRSYADELQKCTAKQKAEHKLR